ncbi:MAG TPA: ATP-binding cassette domain-containing protein, partial [Anaerolineales bacterium]|nr:ATP-binding cassette domain-containing protein [Anaerolineales bacterium]
AVADDITVLRLGTVVGSIDPKEATSEILATMMVGRDVTLVVQKKLSEPGRAVLDVKDLYVRDERQNMTVQGVSFEVRKGEVLGVAGVQGNGQTELVYALTGLLPLEAGTIHLLDEAIHHTSPRHILEKGVAHIPEDRQRHGLILSFPIHDNMMLCTYYKDPFAKGISLQQKTIFENAEQLVKQYDVRTPNIYVNAGTLSGGNQQKVIVAREFSRPIELLIASQPTRGLDVGSIEYIHSQIIKKRDEGSGVLLVSSELDEILALSDRIAVMYKGQIMAIVDASKATKEQLGLLMAGVHPSETSNKN